MKSRYVYGYFHDDALGLPGPEQRRFVDETDAAHPVCERPPYPITRDENGKGYHLNPEEKAVRL